MSSENEATTETMTTEAEAAATTETQATAKQESSTSTVLGSPPADAGAKPAEGEVAAEGAAKEGEKPAEVSEGEGEDSKATSIEVKAPEGVEVDEAQLGKFKDVAQELGLDSEGAQKLMDLYGELQTGLVEATAGQLEEARKGWIEEVRADKELGGTNFERTTNRAKAAMLRFGDDTLREFLDSTGLGDHPALIRAFERIGGAIAESTVAGTGGAAVPAKSTPESQAAAMYPASIEEMRKS